MSELQDEATLPINNDKENATLDTKSNNEQTEKLDDSNVKNPEDQNTNSEKTDKNNETDTFVSDFEAANAAFLKQTQAKEVNAEKKGKIKRYFKIGSILVGFSLFIFIIWKIFYSGSKLYDNSIPYIFNSKFRQILDTFFSLGHHNSVLLVYGPSGCGKSRGLFLYNDELISNGRLSFVLDYSSLPIHPTQDSLVHFYYKAFHDSLVKLDSTFSKQNQINLQAAIEKITPIVTANSPVLLQPLDIQDPTLITLDSLFYALSNSFSFSRFFECLNILTMANPSFAPSVIVTHLETQEDVFAIPIFASLFDVPNKYSQISIAIEITDQTFIFEHPEYLSKARQVYVPEFDPEEVRTYLIKNKIFSKSNYKVLSQQFNGHGESYAKAYILLGKGVPINKALKKIKTNAKRHILYSLHTYGEGSLYERIKTLRNLRTNYIYSYDDKIINHFLKTKILSINDSGKLRFTSKIVEETTYEVLKEY